MDYFPVILLFFLVLIFLVRPFTVLFHELGHALSFMISTKQAVTVYIGSLGDTRKSIRFKFGLLTMWFKYNPLFWRGGLCVPSTNHASINKQIFFLLMGPLASTIIALISCYFVFTYDLHGFLKLLLIIFLISSLFDLFINLTPDENPIKLHDGNLTYNDGYKLRQIFQIKKYSKHYQKAVDLYRLNNFSQAATVLTNIINRNFKNQYVYRLSIHSFLHMKNFEKVIELSTDFVKLDNLNADDYANVGIAFSRTDQPLNAVEFYRKSLLLNPNHDIALNNIGFTLILLNKFQEAIESFNKAIEIKPRSAYSYANRGLAKIKSGQVKEGSEDIIYSLQLDAQNAYGCRSLGIYYFDVGDYERSLESFIKAKEADSTTYQIDELISEASRQIQNKRKIN